MCALILGISRAIQTRECFVQDAFRLPHFLYISTSQFIYSLVEWKSYIDRREITGFRIINDNE